MVNCPHCDDLLIVIEERWRVSALSGGFMNKPQRDLEFIIIIKCPGCSRFYVKVIEHHPFEVIK